MNLANFQEKVLFSRLRHKDKRAFIRAYDLYADHIFRFVYFKIGDREEAQDLTSAVFLKTWNYLQDNSDIDASSLKSLFYKIARNAVIDHYRKYSDRNTVSINNDESVLNIVDEKQNPARQTEIALDLERVGKKLQQLKDEYREIIILRFINELSIAEIAAIIDKSRANTRVAVFRALKALRELIEQEKSK